MAAGGRAVVAHPPTLGPGWLERLQRTLPGLVAAGLWGLETFSAEIDEDAHAVLASLVRKHGLRMTGGSDSHGRLKVYAHLGTLRRADGLDYEALQAWDAGVGDRVLHDELA